MTDILVVDDERTVRSGLKTLLVSEGYAVRTARNAAEALASFREKRPSLVLLDVMMPGRNGFSVCEEMRQCDALVPIVFLTAKDDENDHVRAYGLGADDYISKVTCTAELLARIRRALERVAAFRSAASDARTMMMGALHVDFDALSATGDGMEVRLTKTEADILWLLAVERGRLRPYDEILEVVHGGDVSTAAALQTHVSRLKRKLGRTGELIFNERGLGYKLLT